MKTQDLSDYKLSQWIRLALADLLKCERDKRYEVDMGVWHSPNSHCRVCMAGAIMAKTIGISSIEERSPSEGDFRKQLYALDDIREGDIGDALEWMNDSHLDHNLPSQISVVDYHDNRSQWRKDMFKIARMLEGKGL